MIGVRGSGGSAPITDATATANDIVSGKVAYGNDGMIVGTHTCSSGGSTGGGGDGSTQTKEFYIPANSSISDSNSGLIVWAKTYSHKTGKQSKSASDISPDLKTYFTCNAIQSIDISAGSISLKNITDTMSGETSSEFDTTIDATGIRLDDDVHAEGIEYPQLFWCTVAISKTTLYVDMGNGYGYGVTIKVYYK